MDKKAMKRFGYIWDKFYTYDNAVAAIRLGTQNKRQNHTVRRLLCYDASKIKGFPELRGKLDPAKVDKIAKALLKIIPEWQPTPHRHITRKAANGKTREIDCPTLYDHLIHWMLILAIKEPLTRGMYEFSCGSIPGRGIEYARKYIERWVRQDKKSEYFVKLDIKKFYESINHDILKRLFRKRIKDKRMHQTIDSVINTIEKGIPIGSYTSQWFANFYLQEADHFIKQELFKKRRGKRLNYVRHYLRYMDDMLLMGSSKRDLEKAVRQIITMMRDIYGLTIKPCWEIKKLDEYPVDIIGYRFYREHTEMRSSIFLHTKRTAKKINKRKRETGIIKPRDAQSLISLIGWASHCDSKYFYSKYIKPYVNLNELKGIISNDCKKQYSSLVSRKYRPARKQNNGDVMGRDIYGNSGT